MDEALVRSAREGDQQAFAALVEEYYRPIYGLAFSTVGDWQAAEDIAQDTFLAAWTNLRKLRSLDAFGGWLRRIARNLSRNWLRSNAYRRGLAERREALPEELQAVPRAVEDLDRADAQSAIWRALETLSPQLREVVVMYYLEENSIVQTAVVLGVTENAVKKRLQHARPQLRNYFEKQWKLEIERERQRTNPREARQRFMAGMALGPVAEMSGIPGVGIGGLFQQLAQPFSTILSGGSAVPVAVVVGIVLVAGAVVSYLAPLEPINNNPVNEAQLAARSEHPTDPPSTVQSMNDIEPPETTTTAPGGTLKPQGGLGVVSNAPPPVPQPRTVSGRILDEEQQPITGATVTIIATGLEVPVATGATFGGAAGFGGGGFGGGATGESGGVGGGGAVGGVVSVPPAEGIVAGSAAIAGRESLDEALLDDSRRFSTATDADGRFSLEVTGDGLMIIRASAPGYCDNGLTLEPAPELPELELTLLPGILIEGRVISARRRMVSDALVQVTALAWNRDGGASGWGRSPDPWRWTRTDASGKFRLTLEDSGLATFLVRSPSTGTATFESVAVEPGVLVELTFPESAVVRGKITRSDGTPASGVTVRLTACARVETADTTGHAMAQTTGPASDAVTDNEGVYRLDGVDPRVSYTADIIGADGIPLATGMELAAAAGGDVLWNYRIPERIVVTGVVTEDPTGEPVGGVRVVCTVASEETDADIEANLPVAQAVTNPDGAFVMVLTTGGGGYAFGIQTPAGVRAVTQRQVRDGESVVVNLARPVTYTRSFLVVDESGNPIAGASVLIRTEGGAFGYAYPDQTGADGRIQLRDLVAGETVTFEFRYGDHSVERTSASGADGAEEVVVIDIARGRLLPD